MFSTRVDATPSPPQLPGEAMPPLIQADPAHDAAAQVPDPTIETASPSAPRISTPGDVPEQERVMPAATDTRPTPDPPRPAAVKVLQIVDMARDCWESFSQLLNGLGTKVPVTQRLVTEYQQRYDSWVGYLGVFAQENLSLDHRLRNSPEVKSLVVQQLHVVKRNLNAAVELVGKKDAAINQVAYLAEEDNVPRLSPAMKATFAGIEGALDRLHRLGAAIRQASAGQLMSRAKVSASDERLNSFEILAYTVLETLYPAANPNLLEHICKSLKEKYQRVLYLEERKKKYRQGVRHGQQPSLPKSTATREPPVVQSGDDGSVEISPGHRSNAEGSQPSPSKPSQSVLPSASSSAFSEGKFNRSYQPTIQSPDPPRRPTTSIGTSRAVYTPPQILSDHAMYADCQWCFKNYPAEMFSTPAKWRAHQKDDWEPYVCLLEDCAQKAVRDSKPILSFKRSLDWQRHMERHSVEWSREIYKPPTWVCSLDIDPVTSQRKTSRFASEVDFLEHMQKEHPKYTTQQQQRIARHSTVFLSRDANTCPLCCFSADEDEPPSKPETGVDRVTESPAVVSEGGTDPAPSTSSVAKRALEEIAEEDAEDDRNGPEISAEVLQASRRMAKHVADHLHTLTFLIIRLLSLPPCADNDDDRDQDGVSIDPGGADTSDVAHSDYQDLFAKEDETQPPAQGGDMQFDPTERHADLDVTDPGPSQQSQDCLRSLAFQEMYDRLRSIPAATLGTCEWLFTHEKFKSWAACHRGLLLIKGKPGSGKSTLLRYVLDNALFAPKIGNKTFVLSVFFHGRGVELERTQLGLFRSLLFQLLRLAPEALPNLISTFQKHCDDFGEPGTKWQWNLHELRELFSLSVRRILGDHPIWLLIDALDESGKESAVELVRWFTSLLEELPPNPRQFRVCLSCRHYPVLEQGFQFEICLEHENRQDISTYVEAHLPLHILKRATISESITDRAEGIFLWAHLVVRQAVQLYHGGATSQKIENMIDSPTPALDVLCNMLVQDIDKKSTILKLVLWICFATRPLSLDELRWAMAIDADYPHRSLQQCQDAENLASDNNTMERRLRILSRGLVEVAPSTHGSVVRFIHKSVKNFFIDKGLAVLTDGLRSSVTDIIGMAHDQLSRTCIRYLAMEEIGLSRIRDRAVLMSEFPLLHYATTSWVSHVQNSEALSIPQDDLLIYLTTPPEYFMEIWVRVFQIIDPSSADCPPEKTVLLHTASRYQMLGILLEILRRLQQTHTSVDIRDGSGRTPLSWAAENGHVAIVQLLLDRGADIETRDGSGRAPLSWAAEKGREAVARWLLGKGAYIGTRDGYGKTPLSWAARNGHESLVQLLLEKGADVDAKDDFNQTPLSWAAEKGQEAVVQLLLDNGADINTRDNNNRTPLSRAAEKGHAAVISWLLGKRVDIEASDSSGRTPLSWAAEIGHVAIVQLLLDRGAVIETRDYFNRTPLPWAAEKGQEAVVQLLLDNGADIDARDSEYRTPLSWAAENGHEAVVQLLLDKAADVDAKDGFSQTPLSWAAEKGQEAVVQLLLDKAADIDTRDSEHRTPLTWAAENGHRAVVQLLLDKAASIDTRDSKNRTPLSWAAGNGHEAVVQLLLDRGADIDVKDGFNQTPLSWAVEKRQEAVVQLLLDKGADIDAKDSFGQTPLSSAIINRTRRRR